MQAEDINNLKQAIAHIHKVSKEHTVYRAIVSLDENTALQKGYVGREEWQALVTSHANAIAKENNIDLKDFRWCASYHQERGHPHVHVMFWDNSDRVREEYMSPERFEIAAEKIRASFNGEIFKEELKILRVEQDSVKKAIRSTMRNKVEGFDDLRFFVDETRENDNPDVQFYPRDIDRADAELISQRLEELVHLLPKSGQLKYQFLEPNVKAAVDAVSRIALEHTSLNSLYRKLMKSVEEISRTYGNSEESVERNLKRAELAIIKDMGNDVLKAVKSLDWFDSRTDYRENELRSVAHERMFEVADETLNNMFHDAEFSAKHQKFVDSLPMFLTPKHEVLSDALDADKLRELVLMCLNDPNLKSEAKISQAFASMDADEEENTEEFKAVYSYISKQLYDTAIQQKGWDAQSQFLKVNNFLRAFCRMTSPNNALRNSTSRFLLLRELSKQAKKERAIKMQSSTKMWDVQI